MVETVPTIVSPRGKHLCRRWRLVQREHCRRRVLESQFPAGMATVTRAAGLGGSLTPVSQVSGPVEADGIHSANTEPCLSLAWCWALDGKASRQV